MRGPVEANWGALAFPGLCAAAAAALLRLRPGLARGLLAASAALGIAAAGLYAMEVRHPRLIAPAAPAVERFRGQADFAREARSAAARACASLGNAAGCDPADPFVFASTYQVASQLAFYAGWRRFGPAHARPSQLDLWGELPPEGSAFLFVGPGGPPPEAKRLFRAQGEGEPVTFQVQVQEKVVRTGGVTPFTGFLGLRPRPRQE